MAHHDLKSWPANFERLQNGQTFEIRRNDRNFGIGDYVTVREYFPTSGRLSDKTLDFRITGLLPGGSSTPGLDPRFVVLAYSQIKSAAPEGQAPRPEMLPESPRSVFIGYIEDINPVMQIIRAPSGELHQMFAEEMLQGPAQAGQSVMVSVYRDGTRQTRAHQCNHEFDPMTMRCRFCGVPSHEAVTPLRQDGAM